MRRTRRIVIPLGLLLVACGYDSAEIGVDPPPLMVRDEGTAPADSTEYLYDAEGLDLVVNFNRAFEPGEVPYLRIVPRPPGLSSVENPATNPRQIVLHDVVLDPVFPAYRLILDGPAVPAPVVLTYFSTRYQPLAGGIQGHVFISRGRTEPRDALVYALVPLGRDDEFPLSGNEDELFGRPILGVTRSLVVPTEEGGWYSLNDLENFRRYLVFAILDTDRDGDYDLEADWWGYYGDEVGEPIEIMAGVSFGGQMDPPLPEKRRDVDFWLRAPGTLDPFLD